MRNSFIVATLVAGTSLLSPSSHAGDPDARVARVSFVSGDASYQRGDVDGWNELRVNTPLVTGDSLYAPDGGRAEVDLGSGTVVRIDGGTQIDLVNNTADIAQLGVNSGFLDLRTRSFPRGFTMEIDTPNGAATILEPGRYRVEVTDRMATYSVVQGSMSLALDGRQLDVREGESLEIENTDPPTYGYGGLAAETSFQVWADNRDSRFAQSPSARYVNAEVVGYEDLDDHGSWRDTRSFGRVWVPAGMSREWAPYQSGRWIWQDPYGWTWVSAESWGWAPYHYGRWVFTDQYWAWVPPPPRGYRGPPAVMTIQAVYAPALVAFVGGRNWGLSLSIGGPAIGWVPLAPRESYYYPWQVAPRVTSNYTNITVINAVTVVNYNTFTTNVVRPIRVDRAQIERAPVIGFTAVGVVPSRGSLVVSQDRSPGSIVIPRAQRERPLVARLVPPPRPEPFAQKVVQIERTGLPVASPTAVAGSVGKPFVPGAKAPAGVSAISALAPESRKELKARHTAEVRTPKTIERDITPPPVAPPLVQPEPTPAPVKGHGKPPQDVPKQHKNPIVTSTPVTPVATQQNPLPPVTQSVAPPPVKGHGKPPRDVPKQDKNPIVTSPPAPVAKPAAAPPVTPEATPGPETVPPSPPQDVPKKPKKAKGKKPPAPPPPQPPTDPLPTPPPESER